MSTKTPSHITIQIFNGYWTPDIVRAANTCIFIYGDNDIGVGKGGQAIIRDEPNAMGIPTKKLPNMSDHAFYTDSEIQHNIKMIDTAISKIKKKLSEKHNRSYKYNCLVFPADGLGAGLALLHKKAPQTFIYLNIALRNLMEYYQKNSSLRAPFIQKYIIEK